MPNTLIGGYPTEPFGSAYVAAVPSPRPPLQVERIFVQTDAWGSGEWKNVAPVVQKGNVPIVSTKLTGTWAQAAAGSNNARLDAAVDGLIAIPGVKSLPIRPRLCIHHEPEGDGTPADFNLMWKFMENRYLTKLQNAGWDMCVILMGGTMIGWTKWTPAQVDQALAGIKTKAVFADLYEKSTTQAFRPPGDAKSPFKAYFDAAKTRGWLVAMPEMGVYDTTDQAGFINALAGYAPADACEFIIYYNRYAGEGGANATAAIDQDPAALRAFAKLGTVVVTPPETNCDEVEAELAAAMAEINRLETEKAALVAANSALESVNGAQAQALQAANAQITGLNAEVAVLQGRIDAAKVALG